MSSTDDDSLKEENDDKITHFDNIDESSFQENDYDKNLLYIKDIFFKNIKQNIILIILSLILIFSEMIYREPLYKLSLDVEEYLQNKSTKFIIVFFKIITKVGGEYLMAAPVAIVLCFFSLIQSSFYIAGLIFCLHFHSLMKIWYGNKRPFWEKKDLYQDICDAGFGNPSGHSLSSVYLYLTLFSYLNEKKIFKGNKALKILVFIFFLIFVFLIIFSRLILGVHSINQVIFGSSLGLINYALVVHMFKLHKMPISFYKSLFKQKVAVYCISFMLIILQLLSILSCFSFNSDSEKNYGEIIDRTCGKDYPQYRRLNFDGLFGAFIVLALLGMYLGQVLFWYLIDNRYKKKKLKTNNNIDYDMNELEDDYDKNKNSKIIDELIINWNNNRSFSFFSLYNILKLLLVLIICSSPIILFIIISKKANLAIIFVFKFGIPFFFMLFNIFSFGFYNIIEITLGSKEDLLRTNSDKNTEISLI